MKTIDHEIKVTKIDYSRLNSMILNLLEQRDSNVLDLNRLNMEIKRAVLVEPYKISHDYVTMHSEFEIFFFETGTSGIFKLVYPDEANPDEGKISVLSPLGCAILGCREDHTTSFRTPEGRQLVLIVKILYQPEANGEDLW
jgi:regulator of nucleoside diphosphate kinase